MSLFRLVILVFLWGVAMLIGIVIQRLVMGAKGWDQIPFIRWYQLFGDLEVVSTHTATAHTVNVAF